MKAPSKTRTKSTAKKKPVAIKRHRKPDPSHPNGIDIDLDLKTNRADLKILLAVLNPVLAELVKRLKKKPLEGDDEDGCEANPGGYHNITFCEHP